MALTRIESELRYRRLFETAQNGILLVDFETGIILDVNKYLIDLLGYSKTELLKKYLWNIGVFKNIASSKDNFSILQQNKYIRLEDLLLETKTGNKINVNFIANAYQVHGATVIQCNIRDISDRKLIENDLIDARIAAQNVLEDLMVEKSKVEIAKAKEDALLESIGDGVVAIDENGKITLINHAAEKMLGRQAKQLVGQSLFEAWKIFDEKGNQIPENQRPIIIALQGIATTTTTTTTGQSYFYSRKDGSKFPVSINVTPVVADNKIIGAIDVFRDITKEKETDRAKTEFVSLASHQLKTPLSIINWFIEILNQKEVGKLNAKQKEYLEEIYHANKRMVKLVGDFLNISRLETGRLTIKPTPIQFENVIEDTIKNEKNLITAKQCQVIFYKPKAKLPMILLDENLIRQAVYNLLTNAIRYSETGKGTTSIRLEKRPKDKEYLLIISDNGIGIPKNIQQHIFKRFFRADNAQKMAVEGTGLGLYISKMIIESSGGKIWFKSAINKGTKFYVSIPFKGMTENKGEKTFDS